MNTQLDSITHDLFNHNAIEILDGGEGLFPKIRG